MTANNCVARIESYQLPSPEEAVKMFEDEGGHLTHFSEFGQDPLRDDAVRLHNRETTFFSRYPTFDPFFHELVNGDDTLFKQGLLFFISLTHAQ